MAFLFTKKNELTFGVFFKLYLSRRLMNANQRDLPKNLTRQSEIPRFHDDTNSPISSARLSNIEGCNDFKLLSVANSNILSEAAALQNDIVLNSG